jgi:hypothetical protein
MQNLSMDPISICLPGQPVKLGRHGDDRILKEGLAAAKSIIASSHSGCLAADPWRRRMVSIVCARPEPWSQPARRVECLARRVIERYSSARPVLVRSAADEQDASRLGPTLLQSWRLTFHTLVDIALVDDLRTAFPRSRIRDDPPTRDVDAARRRCAHTGRGVRCRAPCSAVRPARPIGPRRGYRPDQAGTSRCRSRLASNGSTSKDGRSYGTRC